MNVTLGSTLRLTSLAALLAAGAAVSVGGEVGSSVRGTAAPAVGSASAGTRLTPPSDHIPAAALRLPVVRHRVAPVVLRHQARPGEVLHFTVQASIDATGRVVQARIVSSPALDLDPAIEAAVRAWRFEPALRAGRSIPVQVEFPLRVDFPGVAVARR